MSIHVNNVALKVMTHRIFESATITVIILNSATLAVEDPTAPLPPFMENVEHIFLGLYSFEMCMKILAMGFIMNKGAYLRDFWCILDFVIVMSAYFTLATQNPEMSIDTGGEEESPGNLNALRAFRVLRPLRTITSIKGLRILVVSLIQALPMIKQTIIVLFFFFLIFAIGGLQMLSGLLKMRCVDTTTGKMIEENGQYIMCGGIEECE